MIQALINVTSLASRLADEQIEKEIYEGKLDYHQVWEKDYEECHGIHESYTISNDGIIIHDKYTTQWEQEILDKYSL